MIIHGNGVSKGKATGILVSADVFSLYVPKAFHNDTENELTKFQKARADALNQLQSVYERALHKVGETDAKIFVMQQMMVHDREFTEKVRTLIKEEGVCAQYAVSAVAEKDVARIVAVEDEYMQARSDDVIDLATRLIRNLSNIRGFCPPKGKRIILYKKTLAPSEIIDFDTKSILAVITSQCSENSHSSILARAMKLPYITGISDDICRYEGKWLCVDADKSIITIEERKPAMSKA